MATPCVSNKLSDDICQMRASRMFRALHAIFH
jgi:hypothetical protein